MEHERRPCAIPMNLKLSWNKSRNLGATDVCLLRLWIIIELCRTLNLLRENKSFNLRIQIDPCTAVPWCEGSQVLRTTTPTGQSHGGTERWRCQTQRWTCRKWSSRIYLSYAANETNVRIMKLNKFLVWRQFKRSDSLTCCSEIRNSPKTIFWIDLPRRIKQQ